MRTPRLRKSKLRTRRAGAPVQHGGVTSEGVVSAILDQASTQVLRLTLPPGTAVITDQNTMSFMTGHLKTTVQMGGALGGGGPGSGAQKGAGFFNAFKRALTGESFLINHVVNQTNEPAEITLAPTIPSAIAEITIAPGEEWKIYPGSMLATTTNVKVTGTLNIFENFRSAFVTGTAIYTTLSVPAGEKPGRAWISGFGGIEKRDITPTTTPFILNNGTFLAMPSRHWNTYVDVGTAGGILDSFVTNLGFVMKIQAPPNDASPPTIPIYMQTLNIVNFQQMIKTIAAAEARRVKDDSSGITFKSDIPGMF